MALVILDRSAIDMTKLLELKGNLMEVQDLVNHIQRTNNNASDLDIESVFGVPQADAATFKTVINNLATILNDNSVDAYLGTIN